MTIADIRTKVKSRFRIVGTLLDGDIDDCAEDVIPLLAPYVKAKTVNTSLTASSDTQSLTIPTAGADLRAIYYKINDTWVPYKEYTKDGDTIYLKEWFADSTDIRLHLSVPYTVATIANIPTDYQTAVFDLASAEFASLLAGDKARYNIYAQTSGARGVDNMMELSEFYEQRAERRLMRLGGSEALL